MILNAEKVAKQLLEQQPISMRIRFRSNGRYWQSEMEPDAKMAGFRYAMLDSFLKVTARSHAEITKQLGFSSSHINLLIAFGLEGGWIIASEQ